MTTQQSVAKQSTPYMPDSARKGMPNSAMQPLPLYLREDFAQSLDRSRPHELIVQTVKGKAVDPKRQGSLSYRYLDTGEAICVPNIWYNQTREMRVEWWTFEADRTAGALARAKKLLANLEQASQATPSDKNLAREVRLQRLGVEEQERCTAAAAQALKDVTSGERFL